MCYLVHLAFMEHRDPEFRAIRLKECCGRQLARPPRKGHGVVGNRKTSRTGASPRRKPNAQEIIAHDVEDIGRHYATGILEEFRAIEQETAEARAILRSEHPRG